MTAFRLERTNICNFCKCTFHPWHSNPLAKFCSQNCGAANRRARVTLTCKTCGKSFETHRFRVQAGKVRFCSQKCKGAEDRIRLLGDAAPWYKGGWINENGYRVISVDSKKYLEHRYVMEQHVGRPLRDDEAVHHKDGNKLNNSIDNLQLMSYPEHMKLHWRTGHYENRGKNQ